MDRESEPDAGPQTDGTAPLPRVDDSDDDRKAPALKSGPHPVFGSLADDPRLPIWIGRAAVAVIVGVGVSIWLNWRYGLTAAALIAIADTIYRSKTTSVIPAAVRVTSAQRRSRRRLAMLRPYGYVALHARAIPGTGSVIDHLVVGPGGIYALDSEYWDRRLPVRSAATSGLLYHGPFGRRDRLEHARWEAGQASLLLREALHRPVRVRPAMAIYGPKIPWGVASLDGVDVFAGSNLRKYFRRQTRKTRKNPADRLDPEQIAVLYNAAATALPPFR
jgi:Nuclease-related domain